MAISHGVFSIILLSIVTLRNADACGALSGVPSVPMGGGGGGSPEGGGPMGRKAKRRCLHADVPILMADGSLQKAGELRVGDRVWSEDGDGTSVVLTPVADLDITQSFIRFHTEHGHGTTLTPDHAVFARPCSREHDAAWPIKRSGDLVIGECVPTVDGKEDQVVHVESVELVGRVQPITQSGKIATNGVIVSCYDYTGQNDTQQRRHEPFEPTRIMYKWAEKIYNTISNEQYAMGVIKGLIEGTGLEKLYYQ